MVPERVAASMRFSMYTKLHWLMWCLRCFKLECLLHLQSQAAHALHQKLDEFEFSWCLLSAPAEALLDKMFNHLTASKLILNGSLPSVVLSPFA